MNDVIAVTMQDFSTVTAQVSAMWVSIALLAAGYARTRNRSPWSWFFLTAFLGPIAAFFLVTMRALPAPDSVSVDDEGQISR